MSYSQTNHTVNENEATNNNDLQQFKCDTNEDTHICLRNLQLKHSDRLLIGHLNENSRRYKFQTLKFVIKENFDILVVTETKIDISFPESQFKIDDFNSPFRLDRTMWWITGILLIKYTKQIIEN